MANDPDVGTSGRGSGLLPEERGRIQYLWMYKFIFDHPEWLINSLLMAVAQIIPIVGPIVLTGYGIEMIERMHLRPDRLYPKFDFGRFTDYLTRGIWPFLTAMISTFVIVAVLVPLWFIGVFAAVLAGNAVHPVVGVFLAIVIYLVVLAVSFGAGFVLQPIMLRAGLTQDLKLAFDFGFVRDYVSLVWKEMLISMLWLGFSGFVVALCGLCVCFVGVYLAATIILAAHWHSTYQLYELFLDRGGREIPLKSAGEV